MCLWGFLTGRYGSSAKVADGRLVISMPDAETPVIWIMDLNDAETAVLRLEVDKQGLNVIKKHGGKGVAETVAVYRSRSKAERAMIKASKALENARNTRLHVGPNSQPVIIRPAGRMARIFSFIMSVIVVIILLLYARMSLIYNLSATMEQPQISATKMGADSAIPQTPPADTSGVPLSADDFLKNNKANMQ